MKTDSSAPPWWQTAVFYQIYPRSFADGNGDGIGDFHGITGRLDYLRDLGIGGIWLSPHFPSPFRDCGYDVTDYREVAPEYGGMAAFRGFLDAAHERGIRVILDLVLNHTSSEHPWFLESASSLTNPKRDWYVWRDGRDGAEPNNWYSGFGGSAWEKHPATGQYYYHFYLKEQPDLNWRNPAVKDAMWDMVRYWLRLGVDGFRLDAVTTIFEDPHLRDHQADINDRELTTRFARIRSPEDFTAVMKDHDLMFAGQVELPGLHDLLRELRGIVDEFPDRVLIGESANLSYHGNGTDELHMVFNFPLMHAQPFKPAEVLANQRERLPRIPTGAWPCNTLGNHDSGRSFTRLGETGNPEAHARLALALMLTLPGTPVLYYGDEVGMTDLLLHDPAAIRDRYVFQVYPEFAPGNPLTPEDALKMARFSRDRCRTPMQWSREPLAGFCPAEVNPWLPVNPNYRDGVNVDSQTADPGSLLEFCRHLIALRQATPALLDGEFAALDETAAAACLVFRRRRQTGECCLVALNFSADPQPLPPLESGRNSRVIFSESPARSHPPPASASAALAPFEIRLCFRDCG